ncbi:phosphotransferase [Plantactinospora soyae]|uniref:Spectinomycin phosphotransferase/16S rRNA (Guanine(1405)-N(7))-methyltransferase n=1 Tax=Plantactinospora soyae TaxID=1544732 RepID=A0A927R3R4_9ACTN|nr:aminoglycoside phosphotransferase family protein [Plantactinospora soyae]MBE1492088.1 spectinomycin phosphotransferase/16S rRNA (guanine(1405)-N(7))-methyltransferase [Plantactinospora soyae]
MLTPPDGLPEDALRTTLRQEWGLDVAALAYRPVGFGSHHWEAVDIGQVRWFVTVDELEVKRHVLDEPLDTPFDRLRAALGTTARLREHGHPYVVAPVPTRDGAPLARLSDRFGVSLYPYVEGQSFEWGEFATATQRNAVLDLVVALHTTPEELRAAALADDFAIAHRDELESSLDGAGDVDGLGPYARPAADLLVEYAAPVRRLLARYDALVSTARTEPSRTVLTHGEPHPGNVMRVGDDWLLIDWETVLLAPPERDLWILSAGDDSVLGAYADATGTIPLAPVLELYRIRWHLADIAFEVSRFRSPHSGDAGDDESWKVLRSVLEHIATEPAGTN